MRHALHWFEIPVKNMDRATAFYSQVLNITFHREDFMGIENALFPTGEDAVGGALVQSDISPSLSGSLVYLNAMADFDGAITRVPAAGGKVIVPKTMIGNNNGYIAIIVDTEGNRVGLHTPY